MPMPRPGFRTPAGLLARKPSLLSASGRVLAYDGRGDRKRGVWYAGKCFEGPHLDPAIVALIASAGGMNVHGEPRFRVVWGYRSLGFIGGEHADGFVGVRIAPTQHVNNPERWYLEEWESPEEIGSPDLWASLTTAWIRAQTVESLGPYPARGQWKLVHCLQDDRRDFLPLVPNVVDMVVRLVLNAKDRRHSEKKAALEAVQAQKDHDFDSLADDIVSDGSLPFHGQRFVSQVPGIPASDGKGFGL